MATPNREGVLLKPEPLPDESPAPSSSEDSKKPEKKPKWKGIETYVNLDDIDIGDTAGMSAQEILKAKLSKFEEMYGENAIPTYTPEGLPEVYWDTYGVYNPYGQALISDIGDQFLQSPSRPNYANIDYDLTPEQQLYMAMYAENIGQQYGLSTDVFTYLSNFTSPEDQYYLDVINTRTAAENFLTTKMTDILINDFLNGGPDLGAIRGELTPAQKRRAYELMGTTEGRINYEIDQWAKQQFLDTYGEYGITESDWDRVVRDYATWAKTDRGKLALQLTYDLNYTTAALAAGVPITEMPNAKELMPWLFEDDPYDPGSRALTREEKTHGAADVAFREITKGFDTLDDLSEKEKELFDENFYDPIESEPAYDVFYDYISGFDEAQQRWFYENAGTIYKNFFGDSYQTSTDYKRYLSRIDPEKLKAVEEVRESSLSELDKAIEEAVRFLNVAEEHWAEVNEGVVNDTRKLVEREINMYPFGGDAEAYLAEMNIGLETPYETIDDYILALSGEAPGELPADITSGRTLVESLQKRRKDYDFQTQTLQNQVYEGDDPWLEYLKKQTPGEVHFAARAPIGQRIKTAPEPREYQYREELGGAAGGDSQFKGTRGWAPKAIWRV